jgi:hypothetical protein
MKGRQAVGADWEAVVDSLLPLPKRSGQKLTRDQHLDLIQRRARLRKGLITQILNLQERNRDLRNEISLLENQLNIDHDDSLTAARVIARVAEITEQRVTDISMHRPDLNDDDLHGLVFQFHAGPMRFTLQPDRSELLVEQKGMRPRPLGCCRAGLTRDGVELLYVFIDQVKRPKRWRKLLPQDLWSQVYAPSPKKKRKKQSDKSSRAVQHALEVTEGWQDES